jgi:hypothetical protein
LLLRVLNSQAERPLIVDLDGTSGRTDLLPKCFFQIFQHPPYALTALISRKSRNIDLKTWLAEQNWADFDALPVNEVVLHFLETEKANGRPIYLVSAADPPYAQEFANRVGLFNGAIELKKGMNPADSVKAERLCQLFGNGGFDCICNARGDEAIWRAAAHVYILNARPKYLAALRRWHPT